MTSRVEFIAKAGKAANILLAAGALVLLLGLFYVVYRHGPAGKMLFALVSLIIAALLFASFRLNPIYKLNLVMLGLSLALCGYAAEAYLYFSNPMPYELRKPITAIDGAPEWKKQRARSFAKQFGVDFDTRDTVEVVTDLRNKGIDAVPFVSPSNNLFKKGPDGSLHLDNKFGLKNVVPLSGIANKTTVLCNESGQYVSYRSDMYGFNNPQNIWKSPAIEVAALGDSFAQGYCVPPDKNFVAVIRSRYPATLNLGIAGDDPLLMLATLKEYAASLRPKTVLWFYFEGNDLRDLQAHRQLNVLARYVEDTFLQNLREQQSAIDQALISYVDQIQRRPLQNGDRSGLPVRHLMEFFKLSGLRTRSGLISTSDRASEEAGSEANMALFRRILSQATSQVDSWGGKLYFVYLPDWSRYAQDSNIYDQQRAEVLDYVKSLGISLIDIHPVFQAQADPLSLFPFGEPNHYNEKGHKLVADEVLRILQH